MFLVTLKTPHVSLSIIACCVVTTAWAKHFVHEPLLCNSYCLHFMPVPFEIFRAPKRKGKSIQLLQGVLSRWNRLPIIRVHHEQCE